MEKKERDFKGVWIPKILWLNSELSIIEKCLLVEIDSLDNDPDKGCWASNEYLGQFIGISEGSCANMISKLKKRNYVLQVFFDGRNRGLRANFSPERTQENESSVHKFMKAEPTNKLKQRSRKNEQSNTSNNTENNTKEEREERPLSPNNKSGKIKTQAMCVTGGCMELKADGYNRCAQHELEAQNLLNSLQKTPYPIGQIIKSDNGAEMQELIAAWADLCSTTKWSFANYNYKEKCLLPLKKFSVPFVTHILKQAKEGNMGNGWAKLYFEGETELAYEKWQKTKQANTQTFQQPHPNFPNKPLYVPLFADKWIKVKNWRVALAELENGQDKEFSLVEISKMLQHTEPLNIHNYVKTI